MNAGAIRDIWEVAMFFKFWKLHEPHEMHERSYDFFFIFNILNKIVEKSKKMLPPSCFSTQLCSGFQTASSRVLFQPITILR